MNDRQTDSETNHFDDDTFFQDTIVGAVVVTSTALGGGYLCGLMIDQFGATGGISLWALGFVSGSMAVKTTHGRSLVLAGALIAACVAAFVIAEVLWIHWNIKDADTLSAALAKFPLFLKEYKVSAFIAGVFTFFGCHSAYRQIAPR